MDWNALKERNRAALLTDVVPFWLQHGWDRTRGGILSCLDRTGEVLDTDKGLWVQARCAWMFSTLYLTMEHNDEWLAFARSCGAFIEQHGYDTDGRLWFQVTREGKPLRKRRYVGTEAYAAMGFAALAAATGDNHWANLARNAAATFRRFATDEETLPAKIEPDTRPAVGLGGQILQIALSQALREHLGESRVNGWIDESLKTIDHLLIKRDRRAVMEMVAPDGSLIDHFQGRTLNPGHGLQLAWLVLLEARHRNDSQLVTLGTELATFSLERGWDQKHGGLFYFRDLDNKPHHEYWHDMKFWWPHNEGANAFLLAFALTGNPEHRHCYELVTDWAERRFPDPDHGEWFGYLHRDGSQSSSLKGDLWKGPFHLPRSQWFAATLDP